MSIVSLSEVVYKLGATFIPFRGILDQTKSKSPSILRYISSNNVFEIFLCLYFHTSTKKRSAIS